MWRVSIYIDVSSQYPVQGTALTYAPGGCRTCMHFEAVLLAQHLYSIVMIHCINIISMKLLAFIFWFLGFFPPDLRSQIVRKVLSFCLQVTDRSLTLNIQQNNSSIVGSYSVWYGEFLLYLKVSSLFPMLNILFES